MKNIIVAGAGFVGVGCAIALLKKGYRVTLVDRNEPGEEASYGNAGVIANNAIHPLASPELRSQLIKLSANRDSRFRLYWPHFGLLMPWLRQFVRRCNNKDSQRCMAALGNILASCRDDHLELLAQSGALAYLNDTGWLRLYRSESSFNDTQGVRRSYDEYGIKYQVVNSGEINDLEPSLIRQYSNGIWLTDTPTLTNPGAVCKAYGALFQKLGGEFLRTSIHSLESSGNGWALQTDKGPLPGEHVVIAMGAASPKLLKTVNIVSPIAIERGYHHLYEPIPGKSLIRSILDTDKGFVLTPMEMGIRVTSAVELVARHTHSTPIQITNLAEEIRGTLPLGQQQLDHPWMGNRPSAPDSLPIIGPTKGYPGLWQAYGHGHLGLTMGPTTGKWIADFIEGRPMSDEQALCLPSRVP